MRHYDYENECTDTSRYPRGRFVSEYGWQSYPSLHTLRGATAPADWSNDSPMMEHRQRHPDGNAQLAAQMARFFDLQNVSFDRFVYLSQACLPLLSAQEWCSLSCDRRPAPVAGGAVALHRHAVALLPRAQAGVLCLPPRFIFYLSGRVECI